MALRQNDHEIVKSEYYVITTELNDIKSKLTITQNTLVNSQNSEAHWKMQYQNSFIQNENQLFNDKAFISHLVYNHNTTTNISIDKNRDIIQKTLKLLNNEDKEVIFAIVKELKNSDKYKFIKNDTLLVLISLAKKSELPSQLENSNPRGRSFKP